MSNIETDWNIADAFDALVTPYERLLREILVYGKRREDRTGVGTRSIFGGRMEFDLCDNTLPLVTTKKVFLKGIIYELLWFLRGDTNVKWLQEHGVHIWDEWADENGNLGPVYGHQWRHWDLVWTGDLYVDQIQKLVDGLKNDPYSRRHILSAWNVADLDDMALPPCHLLCQFYVEDTFEGKSLSCQLYQRSADMFLGVPFNIAEYSILTMMLAQQVGMNPGRFIWVGGDCHIYENHMDQVTEQLHRLPYSFPRMWITKAKDMFSYSYEDFHLEDYWCHPAIKAPVAV